VNSSSRPSLRSNGTQRRCDRCSGCACQRPHPRRWQVRSALTETDCVAGVTGKPRHGPQRPDCVAGHGGLELRNVIANYLFEILHRFARFQPNSGLRDCSRLSCSAGDTQLGAGFCRDLSASGRDDICTWCRPTGETLITLSPPRRRRIVARIFSCSSVGLLCPSTKARVPAVSPFPRAELHDYDVLADGETEVPSAVIVQLASSRSEKNGF
jgi:hypothetical protein